MSKNINIREQTIYGMFWKLSERFGAQLVSFIVSIILARLLLPEDYGLIAIVTIFITISDVFVSSGFGNALIQKKNADDLDFSTVFYFSLVFSVVIYLLIYTSAPFIGEYFGSDLLIPVTRVMGLRIIIASINTIQHAYVSRTMQFKKFFISTLTGTLISAILGIILAYNDYGVWALVFQYLSNSIIDTVVLWFVIKWRPRFQFSTQRLAKLFSYSWKVLVTNLTKSLYNNLRSIIIARLYTSADLAYYNRGKQLPDLLVNNINSSLISVLFPAMSKYQDDLSVMKKMVRRTIKIGSYLIFPAMVGLVAIAEPLVIFLLTDKWINSIPFIQIFCFHGATMTLQSVNLQAIYAMGKSDTVLRLEVLKRFTDLIILLISMRYGVLAIALSSLISVTLSTLFNMYPNKKLLNYTYVDQFIDIIPNLGTAILMGIVVFLIGFINFPVPITITIQIFTGVTIYVGLSYLLKNDSFFYLIRIIKGYHKK